MLLPLLLLVAAAAVVFVDGGNDSSMVATLRDVEMGAQCPIELKSFYKCYDKIETDLLFLGE